MASLASVEEVTATLNQHLRAGERITLPLIESVGFVLAEEIVALEHQPPFHRVMMDGYALKTSSVLNHQTNFTVQAIQKAGEPPLTLTSPDLCIEIMTGAVLPQGCDAVVPYEWCEKGEREMTLMKTDVHEGLFVHLEGSDYKKGERLLEKGNVIHAPLISLLASNGHSSVEVLKKPRILVVSTGDELVESDSTRESYQIRRSNSQAIIAEFKEQGFRDLEEIHLKDDLEIILSTLSKKVEDVDCLLFSGGISKGKYDLIPETLKTLSFNLHIHGVKQRPGKPFLFATNSEGKVVFGLPGNPVSTLMNLRKWVVPYCQKMSGFSVDEKRIKVKDDYQLKNTFTNYLPVKIENGEAVILQGNNSGDFYTLARSHGFVVSEEGTEWIRSGDELSVFEWGR